MVGNMWLLSVTLREQCHLGAEGRSMTAIIHTDVSVKALLSIVYLHSFLCLSIILLFPNVGSSHNLEKSNRFILLLSMLA